MKKLISIFTFVFISFFSYCKDINVGDTISITANGISQQEITDAFKNSKFELESIEKENNGYLIKFKTFFPGKNELLIGNKKIIIDTKSVLTEKDKNIYDNLTDKSDTKLYNINFPYGVILSALFLILSAFYLLKSIRYKKSIKIPSPEQIFNENINNLNDSTWPFQLSMTIREYIDKKLNTHFVNGIYNIVPPLKNEDIDFLLFLDNYKFSGEEKNIKEKSIDTVKEIFNRIRGENNEI